MSEGLYLGSKICLTGTDAGCFQAGCVQASQLIVVATITDVTSTAFRFKFCEDVADKLPPFHKTSKHFDSVECAIAKEAYAADTIKEQLTTGIALQDSKLLSMAIRNVERVRGVDQFVDKLSHLWGAEKVARAKDLLADLQAFRCKNELV
eukprot:COSAG01_NODE_1291_length_10881_cov_33.377017_1_plen_149_part_10